jgi:flagellin FlaB
MMRQLFKSLRKKEVGSIGIGAMIVFIAMVLVAGIAASVLIQTSTRLEAQAMATGAETTDEVSSGVAIFDILGYCATPGTTDISKVAIGVRARAGSDGVDLSQAYVELSDSTTKVVLNYTSAYYVDSGIGEDDVFSKTCFPDDGSTDASRFGIIVVEDVDGSLTSATPVINRGDKVYLGINTTGSFGDLGERMDIWGMVAPEEGSPGIISFTTPASYTDNVIDLQ